MASDPTAWRVLDGVDEQRLAGLRSARAAARQVAWAQLAEVAGGLPVSRVAGIVVPGIVLDLDASIVACHSEKENASPTWKRTFGYHPLLCFLDNTGEALAGLLRTGSAGSNTAADHITVLDRALTQLRDEHRHGSDVLIRTDSAGCSQAFLAHVRGLREQGVRTFFSVGTPITDAIRAAIGIVTDWDQALDTDGDDRDGAQVAELTRLVDPAVLAGFPAGTRLIVRRERPHPGAQLTLFDLDAGWRHQVFATDSPARAGSIGFLEARHRAHARVEDRIRCGKDTGFGRFPSRLFAINAAWLELALTAQDLLAWTRHLLLDGDLAVAEPKKLRYRLLHVAARITRGGRRTFLRIAANWPWARQLVDAFTRLSALPRPIT